MAIRPTVVACALTMLAAAAPAAAEGLFVPAIGPTFGGDTIERTRSYAFSIGAIGSVVGFEFDVGLSPEFFGDSEIFGDNNLTTMTGNLLLMIPFDGGGAGVRPYLVGGAGLLRSRIEGVDDVLDVESNDFGLSVGGGLMAFFGEHVGIRADVRYFRHVSRDEDEEDGVLDLEAFDLGEFDFWRGTIGLALRF